MGQLFLLVVLKSQILAFHVFYAYNEACTSCVIVAVRITQFN